MWFHRSSSSSHLHYHIDQSDQCIRLNNHHRCCFSSRRTLLLLRYSTPLPGSLRKPGKSLRCSVTAWIIDKVLSSDAKYKERRCSSSNFLSDIFRWLPTQDISWSFQSRLVVHPLGVGIVHDNRQLLIFEAVEEMTTHQVACGPTEQLSQDLTGQKIQDQT